MTEHHDPRNIEANLAQKRAALGSTLDELQDRFSVERLAEQALGMIRDNAAGYTRSIDQAVRANPLALAVTGIGLAWLIFGSRGDDDDKADSTWHERDGDGHRHLHDSGRHRGGYNGPDDHGAWADRIDGLRQRASESLRRLEDSARGQVDEWRDYAAERARVLGDFTEDMRSSLSEGLEDLSGAAREEILRARRRAYAARLKLGEGARQGGREIGRLVEDHPMIAGVIAMGLGAAFAAALPRTRVEDRTFGAESDRLMDAAADLLREERARMERVARGVAEEARSSAAGFVDNVKERAAADVEDQGPGGGTTTI